MVRQDENQPRGDAELVDLARSGDDAAFGELWKRHSRAGAAAAQQFASIAAADDLVAEAYLRILRAVQQGGGPRENFRPYLYRTIRNIALDWRSKLPAVSLEVMPELEDPDDAASAVAENTITVRAFRTLPERWQAALWYLDVEGMAPAEASVLLGMSPNAISALAIRARAGFKNAWLQAHVNDTVPEGCEWTTARMGQYVRHSLPRRARERFELHLQGCDHCTALVEELDQLGRRLAALLLPITLGGTVGTGLASHLLTEPAGPAAGAPRPRRSPARLGVAAAATVALVAIGTATWAATSAWRAETSSSTVAELPRDTDASRNPVDRPTPAPTAKPSRPAPVTPTPAPPDIPRTPAVHSAGPALSPALPPDVAPPAPPQVTAPLDGLLTANAQPTFSGTGEPGARIVVARPVDSALVTVASGLVGPDGAWSLAPSSPIPDGTHLVQYWQTDAAGNRSEVTTRVLTVDTVALAPGFDARPPAPQLYLPDVTGSGEPLSTVTLRDEVGAILGSAAVDADGRWMLPLTDPGRGDILVSARQVDRAGNTSPWSADSTAIVFDRPTIPSPAEGEAIPSQSGATVVEIQLAGHEGLHVQVFIDGVSTGNIHELGAAPIARVTPPLADGSHTIGVRYVDSATGRVGSRSNTTFTIG